MRQKEITFAKNVPKITLNAGGEPATKKRRRDVSDKRQLRIALKIGMSVTRRDEQAAALENAKAVRYDFILDILQLLLSSELLLLQ